jgi:hypothetical protein
MSNTENTLKTISSELINKLAEYNKYTSPDIEDKNVKYIPLYLQMELTDKILPEILQELGYDSSKKVQRKVVYINKDSGEETLTIYNTEQYDKHGFYNCMPIIHHNLGNYLYKHQILILRIHQSNLTKFSEMKTFTFTESNGKQTNKKGYIINLNHFERCFVYDNPDKIFNEIQANKDIQFLFEENLKASRMSVDSKSEIPSLNQQVTIPTYNINIELLDLAALILKIPVSEKAWLNSLINKALGETDSLKDK